MYLLSDSRDSVLLFDHTSGASLAPPATADIATLSQWLTRDAAACLVVHNHLLLAKRAHFGQYKTAKALYDAVVARYSSPATTALGRLILPSLFPELSAFATINVVMVGAARGIPCTPFFEGCSPSPLATSYAFAAAVDILRAEDNGVASDLSGKRRSGKGKGGKSGGGGSGGGGGVGSGGGGGGGGGGGSGGFGGGGGGSGGGGGGGDGSSGSGGGGSGGSRGGALQRGGSSGGQRQQQRGRSKIPTPQKLRDWFAQRGASGDKVERPRWEELLRSGVDIFALDYDAILAAMYALSVSAEGDCYLCVRPDLGIEAATRGASESDLPSTALAEPLHTFTLDSGASRCIFCDIRLQLRERFRQDLPVLRLHSDRGGEFSSNLLQKFCRGEGILQSFTLPTSTKQNGIAERRIGLVMEVARTSMIHAAAPHFLWPFAVRYVAHQLNLWPRVSLPETSHTLRWTKKVGDASVFRGLAPSARGAASGGAEPARAEPGGAEPAGAGPVVAEPEGAETGGAESEGAESGGAEPRGTACAGGRAGAWPCLSPWWEPLSPQQMRKWLLSAHALEVALQELEALPLEALELEVLELLVLEVLELLIELEVPEVLELLVLEVLVLEVLELPELAMLEALELETLELETLELEALAPEVLELEALDRAGVGDPGAGGAGAGGTGAGDPGAGGAGAGGAGASCLGAGGTKQQRPSFVPPPPSSLPQPDSALHHPDSPLHAPSPSAGKTDSPSGRREPASCPASLVCAVRTSRRVPRPRPPLVPSTHVMALRPSSVPLRVPLPSPPASSLHGVLDPESGLARAASPTIPRLLTTVVTDPSFESTVAYALVTELVDFAAACRLDYAASLVAESKSVCPPSVGVPHVVAMLLALEGDPDAPDTPTPCSYAEAITGPYSSQWQTTMDAEMASWKSTGTYVDAVPPSRANIVHSMWIFRVKQPPGSPPVFKARYVARGFSQRQQVDFFHTFSLTRKMTTLRVLLHVAAQRDYELHSLDFTTTFLQGSLHEEIWLRRPPGFTGSFPAGTQWSLRRPVYGLRQAPREWHDTPRTMLAALGPLGPAPRPRPSAPWPQAPLPLGLSVPSATSAATAAPTNCTAMASLTVLAFDHEGRPVQFDTWLDDLQLYLLSDSKDSVSLFDLVSGAATAPPATAESATRSQWLTRDAAAR
ncbi:unnamed protein product [Closterium sp. NIES-54]